MELRCYSYDGGAPPMDSWPLEEETTGVVKAGRSPGFNQSHRATTTALHRARSMCWAGT